MVIIFILILMEKICSSANFMGIFYSLGMQTQGLQSTQCCCCFLSFFYLSSLSRSHILQADSEEECQMWVQALNASISHAYKTANSGMDQMVRCFTWPHSELNKFHVIHPCKTCALRDQMKSVISPLS